MKSSRQPGLETLPQEQTSDWNFLIYLNTAYPLIQILLILTQPKALILKASTLQTEITKPVCETLCYDMIPLNTVDTQSNQGQEAALHSK